MKKLRLKIAKLQAERDELSRLKRSRAEVSTTLEAVVAQWLSAGAASIELEVQRAALGEPFALLGTLGPLMVAMMGTDAVKAAFEPALAALPEGMPTAQRLERLKVIADDLDRLETDEEQLVVSTGVERRPDARPEIVLCE